MPRCRVWLNPGLCNCPFPWSHIVCEYYEVYHTLLVRFESVHLGSFRTKMGSHNSRVRVRGQTDTSVLRKVYLPRLPVGDTAVFP